MTLRTMSKSTAAHDAIVYIVDDDNSLREALAELLDMVGLRARCFGSAREFMNAELANVPSCLVLDIRLPGTSGLNLQADLVNAGIRIPVIFMTAYGDIPMSVSAMKAGAAEFLPKPFREQDMLDAIHAAIERDRLRLQQETSTSDVRARFASLTHREREVMELVVEGLMNKQIAARLDLAEVTIKIHRGNVIRKMGARSVVELVKMAELIGLSSASYTRV